MTEPFIAPSRVPAPTLKHRASRQGHLLDGLNARPTEAVHRAAAAARRSLSTQLHRLLRLDEHVDPNTVRAAYLDEGEAFAS